jgi:hypothetical protein
MLYEKCDGLLVGCSLTTQSFKYPTDVLANNSAVANVIALMRTLVSTPNLCEVLSTTPTLFLLLTLAVCKHCFVV